MQQQPSSGVFVWHPPLDCLGTAVACDYEMAGIVSNRIFQRFERPSAIHYAIVRRKVAADKGCRPGLYPSEPSTVVLGVHEQLSRINYPESTSEKGVGHPDRGVCSTRAR